MIIDTAYFTGDLYLPNRGDTIVSSSYTQAINQREPEYLDLVLGNPLHEAFVAGLEVDPVAQRWVDLKDGKNFVYHGVNHRWEGFQNAARRSPIANYTYYWIQRGAASYSTGTGEVLPSTENGSRKSNVDKTTRAWNVMVKMNADLFMYLDANAELYPEWDKEYYSLRHCSRYGYSISSVRSLFTPINPLSI